jgi:predicted SAM-dependent methyltransferase
MDIDSYLNPDLRGSIANIPFTDETFDVVACFELLEHLPYEQLIPISQEIHRVSKKFAILSLPDANRVLRLYIHLPKFGELKTFIPIPRLKPAKHKFNGKHYWEIGKEGFPLHRIIADVKRTGFHIQKTYRTFGNPYHRFFILTK